MPSYSPLTSRPSRRHSVRSQGAATTAIFGARTCEALLEALGWALEMIRPEEAQGWFNHCVYTVVESIIMRIAVERHPNLRLIAMYLCTTLLSSMKIMLD
jgi:hypothetical protein